MSELMLARYETNPILMDEEVRKHFNIPSNKYYTVSMWPHKTAGVVRISNLSREVKNKKISKSS